ncbi:MAG: radical SAM family heme chaperone HemW [Parasphingopyxis sp.]|uniref:radical SAM family heme chaperone HemW n=1 Tax=Parasphingopyxis sp. TaxID=1920299 RepID=UPI003F9F0617
MTGLALYIHWPFCVSKCPYCDFNSHVRERVDQDAWRAALLADMAHEAAVTDNAELTSIFFGGGTPSLMPPKTVAALIEAAEAHWGFAPDIEITLEANPSSVEAARFGDLARAGVNRVSLGLQSLDNQALRFLGRAHDVREGLAALDTAQEAFARVSFDLIYALPGQSVDAWEMELDRALGFGTEHLSLYQLTIEPGTRFATLAARGELDEADPDHGAALYKRTQALTAAAGLPAYEISNHARPGAESRHNLAYWRYRSYAGIGPGAHGRRGAMATIRHKKPENWLSAVDRNGHGLQVEQPLSARERAVESVMMGLRLSSGIAMDALQADILDRDAIARLSSHGLLEQSDGRLIATSEGRLVLNSLLAEILADEPVAA